MQIPERPERSFVYKKLPHKTLGNAFREVGENIKHLAKVEFFPIPFHFLAYHYFGCGTRATIHS